MCNSRLVLSYKIRKKNTLSNTKPAIMLHVHVENVVVVEKMPRHCKQYSLWSSFVEIVGPIRDWPTKIRKLFWTPNITTFQRLLPATFVL